MSRRRAPGVAEERVLLAPAAGDDAMLRSQKVKLDDDGELVELGAGDKKRDDDRGRAQEADVPHQGLTMRDRRAMALLIVLYLLQGIPVGLAFGSIPYLLRARLSYTQIGLFSLASYPYSLKLLWSPIVDAVYSERVGRRKSWIVPIQTLVGCSLWWFGNHVPEIIDREIPDVKRLTLLFFTLVFFAATQDIAVDGWALELLSKENLSFASTAQTIGLNTGYFLSFTVFLAFNSVEFSNKYFRPVAAPLAYPLLSLAGYLKFWAVAFIIVTSYVAFFQAEDPVRPTDEPNMDIRRVYSIMIEICKQRHVQSFILLHLLVKIGGATNDAATSLKLLEKGLSKEDLALAVLIDFPFQMFGGWAAAKWSSGKRPLNPWITATWIRLGFCVIAMLLVGCFPSTQPIPRSYFFLVIACTVLSSFACTIQFVGISAFHTQIADPVIGGTYMTLLNTVSNLGGTWPRYFVLRGVDTFTTAFCQIPTAEKGSFVQGSECVTDAGKLACTELHGTCTTVRDGYFPVSSLCIAIGACLLYFVCMPTARRLQALPSSAWKVKTGR